MSLRSKLLLGYSASEKANCWRRSGKSSTWTNASGMLPKERTKTNTALDIPLAPAVTVEWLNTLKGLAGNPLRVPRASPRSSLQEAARWPSRHAQRCCGGPEPGIDHFTLHDLRRTAATHLSTLGVRPKVAERCLNHKPAGIQGRYDRHTYFEERKQALTQWVNLLADIERGGKSQQFGIAHSFNRHPPARKR